MKAPQTRGFCSPALLHFVQCAQVWNSFWNSQTKKAAFLLSEQASHRQSQG
jgi:hypothetical protein